MSELIESHSRRRAAVIVNNSMSGIDRITVFYEYFFTSLLPHVRS